MDQLGAALPEVVNTPPWRPSIRTGTDDDVVHDHTLAGLLLAGGRRAPTVVTVHGAMNELADVYRRSVRRVARGDLPEPASRALPT